jgi:Holliday junction resolvase RusA-like endonuclease
MPLQPMLRLVHDGERSEARPMTYLLTIIDTHHPGRPPLTMNEFERAHYRKQTAAKRRIQWQIKAALQATPIPKLDQATVSIIQYAPNAIRRDVDGLGAFRKAMLDALVMNNVFPDDNTAHVIDGGNTILLDRENPRIEIRIEPTP